MEQLIIIKTIRLSINMKHWMAGLAAYPLQPKKPSLSLIQLL